MKAILLALSLSGCATIPDGAIVLTVEDQAQMAVERTQIEGLMRMAAAEILRLRKLQNPICAQADYRP